MSTERTREQTRHRSRRPVTCAKRRTDTVPGLTLVPLMCFVSRENLKYSRIVQFGWVVFHITAKGVVQVVERVDECGAGSCRSNVEAANREGWRIGANAYCHKIVQFGCDGLTTNIMVRADPRNRNKVHIPTKGASLFPQDTIKIQSFNLMGFGKYPHKTYEEVSIRHPQYCSWVLGNESPSGPMRPFHTYLHRGLRWWWVTSYQHVSCWFRTTVCPNQKSRL